MSEKPPRVLGILLIVLGLLLVLAGIRIGATGTYFIVAGLGIGFSGGFIAAGKLFGAYFYAITLAVMIVWSLIEQRDNPSQILSQVFVPIILGVYIFSSKVKSRLE